MLNRLKECGAILMALGMLAGPVCYAEDRPLTYDRIDLTAQASGEVRNDTLVAVLSSQREGSDPKLLAEEVNRNTRWALTQATKVPALKVETLGYSTSPIYRNQSLSGWRVRQSIRLEGMDTARLSTLIGALQDRLAVQSIGYRVSSEKRRAAQDRLIQEALSAFRNRADLITKELGRTGYRLVHVNVSTSGIPVRPMQFGTRVAAAEAAVTPPTLEAGTQTVRITVTGTIELVVN